MPEGDTIHKIAQAMQPALLGKTVDHLRLRHRGAVEAIEGETIESIEAVGKHLLVRFSGDWGLQVHLGMHGRWRRYGSNMRRPPATHASVLLKAAGQAYVCTRARRAELVRAADLERLSQRLGPDLGGEPDYDEIVRRARADGNGNRAIAEVLLDQSIAAGIGNVFKSEALFLQRIHPWLELEFVGDQALRSLYQCATELTRQNSSATRRTTVAPADARATRAGPRLWVYGRIHQRCLECGTAVDMDRQGDGARSTYWCPTCQVAQKL